ncbi:MAG TPA: carboxypeptidase regulatory-like domain-containing protein [Candidatus Sumerlaeota bacterium]|nr:carboxypeptidase regulatory-like domain-containing protein [Candidatus Sumerlaeota bacterium]
MVYDGVVLDNQAKLTLYGGSSLTVWGDLNILTSSTIVLPSKNRNGQVEGEWKGIGSTLSAGNLKLDASSRIDADYQGYTAGTFRDGFGPGGGKNGGWYNSGGGGYGGAGGSGNGAGGGTYGSEEFPVDLGSAGGTSDNGSLYGHGGGAIRINVDNTFIQDGLVTALGHDGNGDFGGGSGGSILVNTYRLTGGGFFRADGGATDGYSGGGGGGRIAVYCSENQFMQGQFSAKGGEAGDRDGQDGTIRFIDHPVCNWVSPASGQLHGASAWIEWDVLGVGLYSGGELRAYVNGAEYFLGAGLGARQGVTWDTTQVPDGLCELRLAFRDTDNNLIGEFSTTVLINNSVMWHSGTIETTTTWKADIVHIVEKNLIVAGGVTLFIEPGTIVKFVSNTGITVQDGGILSAPATAQAPIILTSISDDTAGGDSNLDGDLTRPYPGEWRGLTTEGTGQLLLSDYVDVRYAVMRHSGTLAANEIWNGTFLHIVPSDLTIPAGVKLTIQAGAIVKIGSKAGLTVSSGGEISAPGSFAQPVVFTSLLDDSIGGDSNSDGNKTQPAPGDWRWIYIDGAAHFEHARILYGGGTVSGNWDQTGVIRTAGGNTSTTLNACFVENAFFDGALCWGGPVSITNSVFKNMDRAICAHPGSPVRVVNCTLDRNRIGLLVHGGNLEAVNSSVSNSLNSGIQFDFGQVVSLRSNNTWNPLAAGGNCDYVNLTNSTGQNGNIAVNPQYKDPDRDNYRLSYRSPLIDAAEGASASPKDFTGSPRYDDPRTANTGSPTATGSFADVGAFEFVETAESDIDLVVDSVAGPVTVEAGTQVAVTWTIRNTGSANALGPWHDTLSLVSDSAQAAGTELGRVEVLVTTSTLAPGQSITFTKVVRVPGGMEGSYRWQVRTNANGEVFEGRNSANNTTLSSIPTTLSVPELGVGTPVTSSFPASSEAVWYKVRQDAFTQLEVVLDASSIEGQTNLYAGFDAMPSAQSYDRCSRDWNSPDARLALPSPDTARTVYLLVQPDRLSAGALEYNLQARLSSFAIEDIGVRRGGNLGQLTLPVYGSGFLQGLTASLRNSAEGTEVAAQKVELVDSTTVLASFDLRGVALGVYDVVITQNGESRSLANAFSVQQGGGGLLSARLVAPQTARPGRAFYGIIEYANVGDGDLPIPLLILTSESGDSLWPEGATPGTETELQFLGGNPGEISTGVLRPGEQRRVGFNVLPSSSGDTSLLLLSKEGDSQEPFNWDVYFQSVRPDDSHPLWGDAVAAVKSKYPATTYGEFFQILGDAADEMARYHVGSPVVAEIVQYMILREEAFLPGAKVEGKLYLGDASHPLSRVLMTLEDTATSKTCLTRTWYDGSFSFREVPAGKYTLSVQNYFTGDLAPLEIPADGALQGMKIVLTARGRVTGRVLSDWNGEPIGSALVTAMNMLSGEIRSVESDAEGYFEVADMEPGMLRVQASATGFVSPVVKSVELPDRGSASVLFEMTPGGSVQGLVLSPDGKPVAGAVVMARLHGGSGDSNGGQSAETDENGRYEVTGLAAGTYTLVVTASGFGAGTLEGVTMTAGGYLSGVAVYLTQGGGVIGTVRDAKTNLPITNATLLTDAKGRYTKRIFTDKAGVFHFPDLPAGEQNIWIKADQYLTNSFVVTVPAGSDAPLDVSLRPAGRISGVVQLLGNTPVVGVAVTLSPIGPMGTHYRLGQTVSTQGNGDYQFENLLDGTYAVSVGDGGGGTLARQVFALNVTKNDVAVDLTLPAGIITGTVEDANGPVAGQTVSLFQAGQLIESAVSDASGVYQFLAFQTGPFEVGVATKGMGVVMQSGIQVTTGTQTQASPLKAGTAPLSVTVTDSTNGPVPEAVVLVRAVTAPDSEMLTIGERTDAAGVAFFQNLIPGNYQVSVSFRGLAREVRTISVTDSDASPVIQMQAARTVSGWVRDPGNAMLFAYVTAVETSTGECHIALVDSSTGRYVLDTLSDGTYDLWVSDSKHSPAFFEGVTVSATIPSRTLNATLATTATTLVGQVTDPSGTPVACAEVALKDRKGIPLLNTLTGNDGMYQLGPLPQGTWEITVSVPSFLPIQHTVTLPAAGSVQEDFQLNSLMAITISARTIAGPFSSGMEEILGPQLTIGSAATENIQSASLSHAVPNLAALSSDRVTGSEVQASVALSARWGADTLGLEPPEWPFSDSWLLSYAYIKVPRWCQAWDDAYDEASRSARAVREAFDEWRAAYDRFDQLAAADLNLALAQGVLVGAKAFKTIAGIVGTGNGLEESLEAKYGAAATAAIMGGIDRAVDLMGTIGTAMATGDFNGAEFALNQLCELQSTWNDMNGSPNLFGKVMSIYGMIKDFYELAKLSNDMVENDVKNSLSSYATAHEFFLSQARQHHANMRAVQAGADYCQDGKSNKPKRPLPKPPKPKPEDKKKIPKKGSYDPNEKDTVGFGPNGFVQPSETLIFTVHFENMTTASAKTQQVTIADQLDANLDWSSFEVMQVAFANTSVAVPAGLRSYQAQTTVENDPNPVKVNVALDTFSGVVNWTIRSVDQVTGGVPEDPLAGFLPPNDATHVGEGYVTYKVSPRTGLPDGTVIQNQASIVFDVNAPIVTNTTVNTLDGLAPQSAVEALPESSDANFRVTWSGSDNVGGSGIASYDLYVRKDNETAYQLWLGGTTETQAVYQGDPNHVYRFYSIARDQVGNVEAIPAQPDAVTSVHAWLPPTGVSASDGQFLQTIQVTWNSIPMTYYRVFRSTSPRGEWAAISGWITETSFMDQPPQPLVTYFYSVQVARDAQGLTASDFSEADGGWATAPDDSPLNLVWKVTYRGCSVLADAKGNLTVTNSTDRGSVKINAVRPGQKVTPRPGFLTINCGVVPSVTIEGAIGVFYTEAPVKTLTATGQVKSLFAKGCSVQDVTAGNLGQVRMDALVDSSGSGRLESTFLTATATASAPRPASVQLTGVLLQNLVAPSQKIQSVKVGTKKYVNRTTGVTSLSYGEIPGGTIRALELGRVSVQGGVFKPETVMAGASVSPAKFTVQGAGFVTGAKGALQPVFRSGALSPGVMDVQAPLSLSVTGGDAKPGLVISTGSVALFSAKSARFRGSSGVQYIGGKLGLEAADFETTSTRAAWEAAVEVYLSPELLPVLQTQSSVLLSGTGTTSKQKDIRSVFGDTGVTGIFISGATKQPDNTWLPDFSASVISIGAGKAKSGAGTPEIRGESWSAKPIKWGKKSVHTGFKERVPADLP